MSQPDGRWFEGLADHAGAAYLRYSFTKGSQQEVDFLVWALGLRAGMTVLDVGCGPGRHLVRLAEAGIGAIGVDISAGFLSVAAASPARLIRADGRRMPLAGRSVDVAISLCQGGFGLLGHVPDGDLDVLREMARVVKPGGKVALSAFSAYFAVRYLEDRDTFDAATGVNHERTVVKNEQGQDAEFDLWTTCFTPRELGLLAARSGVAVEAIWSVSPGDYAARPPDLEHPEWLLIGSTIAR